MYPNTVKKKQNKNNYLLNKKYYKFGGIFDTNFDAKSTNNPLVINAIIILLFVCTKRFELFRLKLSLVILLLSTR